MLVRCFLFVRFICRPVKELTLLSRDLAYFLFRIALYNVLVIQCVCKVNTKLNGCLIQVERYNAANLDPV